MAGEVRGVMARQRAGLVPRPACPVSPRTVQAVLVLMTFRTGRKRDAVLGMPQLNHSTSFTAFPRVTAARAEEGSDEALDVVARGFDGFPSTLAAAEARVHAAVVLSRWRCSHKSSCCRLAVDLRSTFEC
jgi:hypothetical protein